jgi:hypothetical protein
MASGMATPTGLRSGLLIGTAKAYSCGSKVASGSSMVDGKFCRTS